MRTMADYETRTRRFTRAEYERLIDLGVFQPGEDIELIGGELMVVEPQGAPHYTAIRKTANLDYSRTMRQKSHRATRRCYRSGVDALRGTHTRRLDGHSLYTASHLPGRGIR